MQKLEITKRADARVRGTEMERALWAKQRHGGSLKKEVL